MPTKASLTLRSVKASPILTTEMDGNLTALRDQSIGFADDSSTVLDVDSGSTITIAGAGTVSTAISGSTLTITGSAGAVSPITFVGDDSTGTAVNVGETFKIAGGTNITTAVTGDTLTVTGPDLTSYITATSTDVLQNKTIDTANNTITVVEADISDLGSYITASSSDTLTNKTIDANGTGNAISNLEVADFAGAAIITVAETLAANDSDTALVTAGAIIDYVDAQDANIASDTLTFTNKTFDANGTGNSITNIEVADLASGVLDTDLSSVSASDDTLASAKAIKAYADTKGTLNNVVEDTTPQLGGDLSVNGNSIVSTANGNITLAPNGTGVVLVNNAVLEINDDVGGTDFTNNYGLGTIVLTDPAGPTISLAQSVVGPAIAGSDGGTYPNNVQYLSLNWDNTGTYSRADSSSFAGDVNVSFGYDFTDSKVLMYGGGGPLNISAYDDAGGSYALQAIELAGSQVNAQSELIFDTTYKETITTLTDDSTTDIHIDCSATTVSTFSLNDNKTFVFSNLDEGRSHTLIITNQGSHTATLQGSDSTAVKFPGGAPTITTGAGSIDVITVFYDGVNYLGNIAQNFS